MPNKALARAIIALILASTVGMQVVELAMANPIPWQSTPNQEKPTLTIECPQNNTVFAYNGSDVYLNYTITKPDSWNTRFVPFIGQIVDARVYLDGNVIYGIAKSGSYSVKLNQSSPGLHMLNVTVLSYTYYSGPPYNGSHIFYFQSSSDPVYKYPTVLSDIVYFTVEQQTPTQSAIATGSDYLLDQTNLILIAILITIVAVASLSLVYFKRNKKKLTNK